LAIEKANSKNMAIEALKNEMKTLIQFTFIILLLSIERFWLKRNPCTKCDEDSHGNSLSFHHKNQWHSLVEIDVKLHDYSMCMSFKHVLFVVHAGTWPGFQTRVSHGISMAFPKKLMGLPSDLVSFPTRLPSEREEKVRVTLATGKWCQKKPLDPLLLLMSLRLGRSRHPKVRDIMMLLSFLFSFFLKAFQFRDFLSDGLHYISRSFNSFS